MNTKDIEKFDPSVEELTAMVDKTKGLTAIDLSDKKQLEIVRKSRIELKNKRRDIEKFGKALRDDANKFSKDVIAKEKSLIAIIEPEEDRLEAIEVEAENLAIRNERIEKLPARKERLQTIGDKIEVTDDKLLEMDASAFEEYYNGRMSDKLWNMKVEIEKIEKEKELAREKLIQEEQKKIDADKAEIDRQRAENTREGDRLAQEKEARVREEKARQDERERLQQEEKDRVDREKREKERLEKIKEYLKFKTDHGWTVVTKAEFKEENTGDEVVLWKKLGVFQLNK